MSKKIETNPATEPKELTLQDLANVVGGDGTDGNSEHRRSHDGRSEYVVIKAG
jgi:hypothetical protein